MREIRHNPTVRHGSDRGGDGLAAPLASNGEIAEPGLWQIEHPASIGERKANISTTQGIGFLAFPSVLAGIEYPKNLSIVGRTSRRWAKAIVLACFRDAYFFKVLKRKLQAVRSGFPSSAPRCQVNPIKSILSNSYEQANPSNFNQSVSLGDKTALWHR